MWVYSQISAAVSGICGVGFVCDTTGTVGVTGGDVAGRAACIREPLAPSLSSGVAETMSGGGAM